MIEAYARMARAIFEKQDTAQFKVKDTEVLAGLAETSLLNSVELNLPPGVLTKTAQSCGLLHSDLMLNFSEATYLAMINKKLAPKFHELIKKA